MMLEAVKFVIGCVFVVVGRWLYARPHRVIPQSMMEAHPKSRDDLSRFVALLFVFVGCGSAGFALFEIAPSLGQLILVLGFASAITWMTFRKRG